MFELPFVFAQQPGRNARRYNLPSRVVADGHTFELKQFIGGGGNSAVFCVDVYDNGKFVRRCALKVLKQLDRVRIDRFQNETRILGSVSHPRIAAFYAVGEAEGTPHLDSDGDRLWDDDDQPLILPFVAMDMGGSNLRRLVETSGPLTGADFKTAATDMCEAILHLHSKELIHRDIKPENFVVSQREAGHVLMIDFGIAKYVGEDVASRPLDNLTKQKEFVGPQAFCSPELLSYARDKTVPVDVRSDLFQLGKVLWFLATGMVSAGIPSKRLDPFKGSLHHLVSLLLCDDPADRQVPDLVAAIKSL